MTGNDLIGKTEAEARTLCEQNGYKMRVGIRDGMPIQGTCDMRDDRINVIVTNGNVGSVIGIG